ncbi:MAG TPA: GDSL-type esterase/lipase family protein [bacterium]|nr:GDSL-type esterase/lipase family protein [bacterium]
MPPPYRVIALGDSLTYGYPFGKNLSWVEYTAKELHTPILNQGINGNTLRDMLRRVTIDVLDLKPEFCIVFGGANDVYQGVDLELMQSNLLKLLELLDEHEIRPILALPPPLEDEVYEKILGKFRRWLKARAKEQKIPVIDFHAAFIDPKKKKPTAAFYEDGIHPSSKGYQAMAKAAVKVLQPALAKSA